MRIILSILLTAISLSNCINTRQENTSQNNIREIIPEPDKAERLRYEAFQKLQNSECSFLNPDTSILSLNIRDATSGKTFIGSDKPGTQEKYRYYSKNLQQLLTLTQHPGDGKYQISIFRVEYSKKNDYGYRIVDVDSFRTEKGIRLGMSKSEILDRLGYCYASLDSTKEYMELYYKIEAPRDTKTNLLANHNLPVYYASYKIRNGNLEKFEFGFEYP